MVFPLLYGGTAGISGHAPLGVDPRILSWSGVAVGPAGMPGAGFQAAAECGIDVALTLRSHHTGALRRSIGNTVPWIY